MLEDVFPQSQLYKHKTLRELFMFCDLHFDNRKKTSHSSIFSPYFLSSKNHFIKFMKLEELEKAVESFKNQASTVVYIEL